jgi:hypothetical protein
MGDLRTFGSSVGSQGDPSGDPDGLRKSTGLENRGCRRSRDYSWMWLGAAFLVLVGGFALLIALLFWLPGVRL